MPFSPERSSSYSIRSIVLAFVLLSLLWLLGTHAALWQTVPDPFVQMVAGWVSDAAYIAFMGAVLWAALSRYERRKNQAQAGQQAEQLLQTLIRSSPDAIYAKATDGRYLLVNPEAGRLMRRVPEWLVGQDDTRVFPPAQYHAIRANDLQVMGQQHAQSFEETLDTADGLRTFDSIKGPLRDARGQVVGMFGISRDITAALDARQQLLASEQRYRALFDSSPLPMSVFHRESLRLLAVNQAALAQYGYTREELLGMTLYDIRPAQDHARLRDNLARYGGPTSQALGGGQRWHHLRKDGSLIEVETAVSQIEFEGQPACIGLIHDVTRQAGLEREREQALIAAQQSRDDLRSVLARVDDGFIEFDTNWNYVDVNPRAARMLGRERPEDLIGRHAWTEFPDRVGEPFHRAYLRAVRTQTPETLEEYFHPSDRWFEVRAYPFPTGLCAYLTDITERKRAERVREQAQAEVTRSRDELKRVLARVQDGFVALDTDWVYTFVNPQAARLLGRDKPEDLLGRHIWTEYPEGVGQPFHRAYLRAMETQQTEVFESFYEPWGRWFENRLYPSPEGLSIYFTDITERKRTEQVLADRAREFRELAEQVPAMIYRAALDGSNRTLYVNPQVRVLGFTPEVWLADPTRWVHAVHPDDLARVIAALPSATSEHSEAQVEYRMRAADGRWRHFRDSSRRVLADDGSTPYLQGVSVDITDLIEAQQAIQAGEVRLRLSEQRYRLAASGGMVWDWEPAGGGVNIAPEFWTRLGWPPCDPGALVARLEELLHPDDLPRWRQVVRDHLRERQPYDIEYRVQDVARQWRWFHTRGQARWDGTGRAVYMAGTTVDVTARVQALQALQDSEARLRHSELRYRLAASHGKIWEWDLALQRADFGSELWEQLGYRGTEADGSLELLEKVMHPADRSRWRHVVRQHIAHREPYELEFRVQTAAGDWVWLHSQGQAVWDEQGIATYMAGTTVDITERKRAQAQLQASETYRRQLFEQLADGVVLLDGTYRIRDANPMAGSLLGRPHTALLGMPLLDLIPPEERGRVEREIGDQRVALSEWRLRRADGASFPAEVSLRTLPSGHTLAVLRDISERRRAQDVVMAYQLELSELAQRLLLQEKEVSQRIAQGLHDRVGQTLAVTRLHLDAAMSSVGHLMPPPAVEQCRYIDGLLGRAVQEVRDVLSELRPPLLQEQGLVAALDNEIARPAAELGGGDVLLELDEGVAARKWPPDVEYAAFMVAREAINNALRHARPSLVRVLLGGDAGHLALEVVDDGVGIEQHHMAGRAGHLGLVGMRERALAAGADFSITAETGGGTRVSFRWEGVSA